MAESIAAPFTGGSMEDTETTYTLEEYTRLTDEQKHAHQEIINQLATTRMRP